MKSEELQYEIKYSEKDKWERVSDKLFLKRLVDNFYHITPDDEFASITPIIIKMLKGREISTTYTYFRTNIRQGAKGVLIPEKRSDSNHSYN